MNCYRCGKKISQLYEIIVGTSPINICKDCIAEVTLDDIKYHGAGYLTLRLSSLTDDTRTLNIPIECSKVGRHNFTGERLDFWFYLDDEIWYGVAYGSSYTALVRRTKRTTLPRCA